MANAKPVNNNRADRGKNKKSGNVKESPEQRRSRLARELGLRPKSKAVIDEILDNPKISHTEAYLKHHGTVNRNSARASVAKLLAKPSAKIYSDSALKRAKQRVVTLVDSENESIALKAAESIIDRREGKAVQRTENTSNTVEIKMDITGTRIGSHYVAGTPVPVIDTEAVS